MSTRPAISQWFVLGLSNLLLTKYWRNDVQLQNYLNTLFRHTHCHSKCGLA